MPPSSHPVRVAWSTRIAVTALCLAVHGCTTVDGGAVELSWKLRPSSGASADFIDCASGLPGTGAVTEIRLTWTVGDETASRSWKCVDGHGVTKFELPEGQALLAVSPVCASGPASVDTFIAPAPEQRRVIVGDTVSLGAVELVLQVSDCNRQPCICQ